MLPDQFKVESLGSIWEIDTLDMRYRRWPKNEAPRKKPEWSDERAGALQDVVWHPMRALPFLLTASFSDYRLAIPHTKRETDAAKEPCVTAPLLSDEFMRLMDLGLEVR